MVIRVFSIYFFCSLFPLLSGALQMAYHARERMMRKDQTVSQLRPNAASLPGSGLTPNREVKTTPNPKQ